MIYLLLGGVSAAFGLSVGLGPTTLLRPLLDAVSPLSPQSVAMLCTMATLCAALVSAFYALGQPLSLAQDELLLLATGALLGGVLGELAGARFLAANDRASALLLQNALLFATIALPAVYFGSLSRTLRPLALTRLAALPVSFLVGLFAAFLSFGAEPLTLLLYFLLFDAENDEAALAALTVSLFAMAGKMATLLVSVRFRLPDADVLIWLLPGAIGGSLLATLPALARGTQRGAQLLLRLSLFTALLNVAAAAL